MIWQNSKQKFWVVWDENLIFQNSIHICVKIEKTIKNIWRSNVLKLFNFCVFRTLSNRKRTTNRNAKITTVSSKIKRIPWILKNRENSMHNDWREKWCTSLIFQPGSILKNNSYCCSAYLWMSVSAFSNENSGYCLTYFTLTKTEIWQLSQSPYNKPQIKLQSVN